jgi:hypothetical protein
MLKRMIIFAFLLSGLVLIALAPMGIHSAPLNSAPQQDTPAPFPTISLTIVVPTSGPAPSGGGMPLSTLIIIGLLVILGIGVIVGGMALMSRR